MPKMSSTTLANPEDLTPYAVKTESWITDGRGHSSLRTPAAEGEDAVTVDLHPRQAQYLISAGQVEPIPGLTKGYPVDSQTGELLDLSADQRRAVEDGPSLGRVDEDQTLVEGSSGQVKGPSEVAESVEATQTGGEETLVPTTDSGVVDTGTAEVGRSSRRPR